jgi:hypothetical protein
MQLINGKELIVSAAEVKDAEEIVAYLNWVRGESDNLLLAKTAFPWTRRLRQSSSRV